MPPAKMLLRVLDTPHIATALFFENSAEQKKLLMSTKFIFNYKNAD